METKPPIVWDSLEEGRSGHEGGKCVTVSKASPVPWADGKGWLQPHRDLLAEVCDTSAEAAFKILREKVQVLNTVVR